METRWLILQFYISGFSHTDDFHLFKLGQVSSEGVKEFAELGTTGAMDKDESIVESSHVLDTFAAPPITEGKGRAETKMFLDGAHSRVSSINYSQRIYRRDFAFFLGH